MKNGKWKRFEKVTAGVRRVEQGGASVKWNSRVEGYRFDAVTRSAYEGREITIVVRCVDYGAPVTEAVVRRFAEEVEAAGGTWGLWPARLNSRRTPSS